MNWRSILSLSVITALGLVLLPGSTVAQQKSLKEQLIGTWTLVAWEQTRPDGSKFQSFGANPKGVQVFGADGRFFIMYARPDLPKIAASDRNKATAEEAKALVGGSLAYYGTYTVDEASKTIVFRIETSTFPNQLGAEQKRTITSLTPEELKYNNPAPTSGGQIQATLKRAK